MGLKRQPDPKSTASSVQCEVDADCSLIGGVIYLEFVPRGQTVSKEYLKIMKWLKEAARRRKLGLWRGKIGRFILTTLRRMPPLWLVIFSNNMRRRLFPASVLARPCTSGFLFFHQAEIHAGKTTI
jgi:hypothetical protein